MNYWPLILLLVCLVEFIFDLSSPPISSGGIFLPIAILLGIGVYTITKKRKAILPQRREINKKLLIATNLVFLVLLLLANIELKASLYERTYTFFFILALSCGVVAVEIILLNGEKTFIYLNLLKSCIIGFNIRISARILSALPIKSDIWFHENLVISKIVETGFFPDVVYKNWPLMHLQMAISRLISNISINYSHFLFVFTTTILSILVLFLIVKKYFDTKKALVASLVMSFLSYSILEMQSPIPSSFGILIFLLSVYSLFNSKDDLRFLVICSICLVALILVHALVPFVLMTILLASITFDKISGFLTRRVLFGFAVIGLFFSISLVSYWMYATSGWYEGLFYTLKTALSSSKSIYEWAPQPESLLSIFGSIYEPLFLFLGTIAICFWGDDEIKEWNFKRFVIISFLLTALIFNLTNIGSESILPDLLNQSKMILPERWHPYFDIFAAIAFSAVFIKLLSRRPVALFLVLFLFSFMEMMFIASELAWIGRDSTSLTIFRDSDYMQMGIFQEKIEKETVFEMKYSYFLEEEPFIPLSNLDQIHNSPIILSVSVEKEGITMLRGEDPTTGYTGIRIPITLGEFSNRDIVFTNGEVLLFY